MPHTLISGRWTYDREDRPVFRVVFATPTGRLRRADARSALSHDIAAAIAQLPA